MQTHSESAITKHPVVTTMDLDLTADLAGGETSEVTAKPLSALPVREAPVQIHSPRQIEAPENPRPRLPVAPGRVLRDRYVLTQLVGSGGMCVVFRARDLEANSRNHQPTFVALKTPRTDAADPARAIARLRREYEHAQNLSHAGIIQVFDLDCDGDVWFMTMEMLEGESLASILRRVRAPLPPHLVRRALHSAAEALAYSHWVGIVHGDLNPANVFVEKNDRIKVLDFGAACSADQLPSAAATPAYASPQVLNGATPTLRDDVFSFACIAYESLTGRHPFGQRPSLVAQSEGVILDIPSDMYPEQADALRAALSWESDARPEDIKELARKLAPPIVRRRTNFIIESEEDLVPPKPSDDTRWWILGGICLVAMIVAVLMTRLG